MRFRRYLMVSVVLAFLVLSGCSKQAPPPNLDVQKKVVHTYLEGIRDHNKDKMYQTVNIGLKTKSMDPDLKQAFANFDNTNGRIKSWVLVDKDSWVDNVNGQALIKAKISTTKTTLPLDIELRTYGDNNWKVFGVRISASGKMDSETTKNPHGKADDTKTTGKTSGSASSDKADKPKVEKPKAE